MSPPTFARIFFDAAGTLFRTRRAVGDHYAEIALRSGGRLDGEQTDAAFRVAWRSAPPVNYPSQRDPELAEREWWRALVDATLEQLPVRQTADIDRAAYFDALFQSYADAAAWSLFPETRRVLDTLAARGFKLAVISNFDRRLISILDGLGIRDHFESVVHSGAAGARKPDPTIFEHALSRSGVSAAHCLHVGDDPDADWCGARQAGLEVYELDRETGDLMGLLTFLGLH